MSGEQMFGDTLHARPSKFCGDRPPAVALTAAGRPTDRPTPSRLPRAAGPTGQETGAYRGTDRRRLTGARRHPGRAGDVARIPRMTRRPSRRLPACQLTARCDTAVTRHIRPPVACTRLENKLLSIQDRDQTDRVTVFTKSNQ